MIAGYPGKSDVFDKAIACFAIAHADQAERDYTKFKHAIHAGKIKVENGAASSLIPVITPQMHRHEQSAAHPCYM